MYVHTYEHADVTKPSKPKIIMCEPTSTHATAKASERKTPCKASVL